MLDPATPTGVPLYGGFLNAVVRDSGTVTKRYSGADAAERRRLEHGVLRRLADVLEVPKVMAGGDERAIVFEFVDGENGQQLIRQGHVELVLELCGATLRRLQAVDARSLADVLPGDGPVIVHGDFGPQNILISPADMKVTAVLDWEFSHLGDPIEDLAWAEWIVRRHHAEASGAIPALFAGYGATPFWRTRKNAMASAIRRMTAFAAERNEGTDVELWSERLEQVLAWSEADFQEGNATR